MRLLQNFLSLISIKSLPIAALSVLLLLALTIGGASRANDISLFVLTSASLVLLSAALLLPGQFKDVKEARPLLYLVGTLIGWTLIQLIPLPSVIWLNFPGRDNIADGFKILGQPLPAMPISLTPDRTLKALLGFIPPLVCFLLGMKCSIRKLSGMVLIGACVISPISVTLGVLQIFSIDDSHLYFHSSTNHGSPVGFFANANHQAIFLVILIPLLCVVLRTSLERLKLGKIDKGVPLCIGAILFYNIIGIVAAGSLAGYLFGAPILLLSLLLFTFPKSRASSLASTGFFALLVIPILLTFLSPNLSGLGVGHYTGGPGSRSDIYERTTDALTDAMPIGTGLGSFESVYKSYEDPGSLSARFINHAHNEYLEILLELGVVGGLITALALLWLAAATFRLFNGNQVAQHHALQIASAMLLWTLIAHSFVDYPLRTPAISCLAAVCILILCKPPTRSQREA